MAIPLRIPLFARQRGPCRVPQMLFLLLHHRHGLPLRLAACHHYRPEAKERRLIMLPCAVTAVAEFFV